MPWVRLDDDFAQHPKVVRAGPLGLALHVAALCYCNRYLTDGHVPLPVAKTLLDFSGLGMKMWEGDIVGGGQDATWELVVEDLVAAGLWGPINGGWEIHDYLDYQPSKTHVEATREARKNAGRTGGYAKALAKRQQNTSKILAKVCPVPVPVPKEEGSKTEARADARSTKGARLGIDWKPSEADRRYCQSLGLDSDRIAEDFRDYWLAKPGGGGVKLDWSRTWRTWCRREADRQPARPIGPRGTGRDRAGFGERAMRVAREMDRTEEAKREQRDVDDDTDARKLADARRGNGTEKSDRGELSTGVKGEPNKGPSRTPGAYSEPGSGGTRATDGELVGPAPKLAG
mgnify:CR=1 FL=1